MRRELERRGDPAEAGKVVRSATAPSVPGSSARRDSGWSVSCAPRTGRAAHPCWMHSSARAFSAWRRPGRFPGMHSPSIRAGVWADGYLPSLQAAGFRSSHDTCSHGTWTTSSFAHVLEQPLILYCHHSDLRDALHPFRAGCGEGSRDGDVRWGTLASITRKNAVCTVRDGVATVAVYSRHLGVSLRPRASSIRVARRHPSSVAVYPAAHRRRRQHATTCLPPAMVATQLRHGFRRRRGPAPNPDLRGRAHGRRRGSATGVRRKLGRSPAGR